MKKFSERMSFVETPQLLQTEGMSEALRNSIWNLLVYIFEVKDPYNNSAMDWFNAAELIARFFRKVLVDDLPSTDDYRRKWIKEYFFSLLWYEVYDFIEFIIDIRVSIVGFEKEDLQEIFNKIFEEELSAYRFIDGIIVPISNSTEIEAISSALDISLDFGLKGAHIHIQTAISLFSKRPDPDYRNAVKEAISAIESVAKQISGSDSKGLSGALDELSKKIKIHPALKDSFVKLYGYSSDENGIRHAILEEPNVGFDEAKYMIVSCSAFINYLISKAQVAGLLKH